MAKPACGRHDLSHRSPCPPPRGGSSMFECSPKSPSKRGTPARRTQDLAWLDRIGKSLNLSTLALLPNKQHNSVRLATTQSTIDRRHSLHRQPLGASDDCRQPPIPPRCPPGRRAQTQRLEVRIA